MASIQMPGGDITMAGVDDAAVSERAGTKGVSPDCINIEVHAHLRQSYFPHLKADPEVQQKRVAVKHQVQLVMQAEGLETSDVEDYLRDICKITDMCREDVIVTEMKHHSAQTTCRVNFPSEKMAKKFKSDMDKIRKQTGCRADLCKPGDTSDNDVAQLADRMEHIKQDCSLIVASHEAKQMELRERVTETQAKNVHLSAMNELIEEREALQQKQMELKNQKQEFLHFMNVFEEEFLMTKNSKDYKDKAAKLEKRYQIERERLHIALPMYAKRTDIVRMIAENQISILLGETGSGKSTQVTQYLYEAGLAGQKKIVCTQPRKVAATSLAKRVSTEMNSQLGDTVGYKVGMQKKMSSKTRILYVTDHILLKECLDDPLLSKYSCVIIDEAHERSINTDLLLGMIKKALVHRPDLRVIITSATINPDVFVAFFNGCPVLKVSGRVFPVEVIYSDEAADPDSNFIHRAVLKTVDIAMDSEPGDILVFLTTPVETEKACERMVQLWPQHKNDLLCLALHGKTQAEDQQKVFDETPAGQRKIVFATNSAETSVTIPGIKVVVDTGLAKEKLYDHKKNMSSLKVTKISQSSANQRKGRAGRTEKGKCYRLYSEEDYKSMDTTSKPEIMKVHLGMALLTLLSFNIDDPLSFDFVEMPPREGLEKAMDVLMYLGAVDKDGKLTSLGKKLATMSLEPSMAKLVLNGIDRGIGFECILIASLSSMGGGMFYRGGSETDKQQADRLKVRFCNLRGDIHSMLDVYKEWSQQPEKERNNWCMSNSINAKCMRMARDSVKEIQGTLASDLKIKVDPQFHEDKEYVEAAVESVMLESYAMNLCVFSGHESLGYMMVTDLDKLVHVHPSSTLKPLAKSPKYLVYENTLTTSRAFVINVTCISEDVCKAFWQKDNAPINMVEDQVESRVVIPRMINNVGATPLKNVFGPGPIARSKLEKTLQEKFQTEMLKVEGNISAGTVLIHAVPGIVDECCELLEGMIATEEGCLYREEVERALEKGATTRAVLGHGGQAKHLLYGDEFRTIHISSVPPELAIEELVEEFRKRAVVADYKSFKSAGKGSNIKELKVSFESTAEAVAVLNWLQREQQSEGKYGMFPGMRAEADVGKAAAGCQSLPGLQSVSIKITWCRRPNRGLAFVKFAPDTPECASDVCAEVLEVEVGGQLCPMSVSRKNSEEIFVPGIPKTLANNEIAEVITEKIKTCTGHQPVTVFVPNEPARETSDSDCAQMKKFIESQIEHRIPGVSGFNVNMRKPTDKAVQCVAFVNVTNGLYVTDIENALRGMAIEGVPTQTQTTLKTAIYVQKEIHSCIKHELESVMRDLQANGDGVNCHKDVVKKSGDYRIDISAHSATDLMEARTKLVRYTEGTQIEVPQPQHLRFLKSTSKGQQFVKEVEKERRVRVTIDRHKSLMVVHGGQEHVEQASAQIIQRIARLKQLEVKEYKLKEQYPAGLVKRLMSRYGLELQGLVEESGIEMVDLQLRYHLLTVHGTQGTIEAVEKVLDGHARVLGKVAKKVERSLPDCPVCMCEVQSHELYRLQYCGHVYCESCIKGLLEHGARDKNFPIQCAENGCGKDIVMKDIFALVGSSGEQLGPFVKASVEAYVSSRGDELKYCITPDCSMVYRVGSGDFTCSLCHVSICTLCHCDYHPGFTCEQNKMIKDGGGPDFDAVSKTTWLREDPVNRALCPKCNTGIEKNGGCQHMKCRCGAHICWRCKKCFPTDDDTYDHLGKCGGIF